MGGFVARINIEDCWWTDPRRSKLTKLLGDENRADGVAVRMWRLAQEFWKDGKKLVPIHIFETLENYNELIQSGLASVEAASVYVRGSSAYLDWVREQREIGKANGSKGGQASVKARLEKYGSAIPLGASNQKTEANPNPSVSGSSSSSYSDSNSSSEVLNSVSTEPKKSVAVTKAKKELVEFKVSNSKTIQVSKDLIDSWVDTFPKEFLDEEIKKARSWILSNPHKSPKSNWGRFLNSWFNRGWDRYRTTLKSNPTKITIDDLNDALGAL